MDDIAWANALMAGSREAWQRFDREARPRLLRFARGLIPAGIDGDRGHETFEDVVGEFVAERVVARSSVMFGAVARGEAELMPRLLASVRNFVRDRIRRGKPVEAPAPQPAGETQDVRARIEGLFRERGSHLARCALSAPQRATLLLDVRREAVKVVRALEDYGFGDDPPSVVAATMASWRIEEASLRVTAESLPLVAVWRALVPIADAPPGSSARIDDKVVAAVMGVTVVRLQQWRHRGREAARDHDPVAFARLFASWEVRCPSP